MVQHITAQDEVHGVVRQFGGFAVTLDENAAIRKTCIASSFAGVGNGYVAHIQTHGQRGAHSRGLQSFQTGPARVVQKHFAGYSLRQPSVAVFQRELRSGIPFCISTMLFFGFPGRIDKTLVAAEVGPFPLAAFSFIECGGKVPGIA